MYFNDKTLLHFLTFSSIEDILNDIENSDIRHLFSVSPPTEVIAPQQSFEVTVTFRCTKLVKFSAVPIFKCTFYDVALNNVIDRFFVTARAKTYFSR